MTQNRLFRWGDAIPMMMCFLLIAVFWVGGITSRAGDRVRVQTPDGTYILSLEDSCEQVFVGKNGLSVTVAVIDGSAAVTNADCDDQICVHTGRLGGAVRAIACVPSGIVVMLDADDDKTPDAVAR